MTTILLLAAQHPSLNTMVVRVMRLAAICAAASRNLRDGVLSRVKRPEGWWAAPTVPERTQRPHDDSASSSKCKLERRAIM